MGDLDEPLEVLQEKLATFRQQLTQVEDALKEVSSEDEAPEDLLRLRVDLQEVISLTESLVQFKQSSGGSESAAPSSSATRSEKKSQDASGKTATSEPTDEAKKKVREFVTPGGYHLPISLQIRPSDTEETIKTKRKKIHAIKSRQRQEISDQHSIERRGVWQKHMTKATRNPKGLAAVRKTSIFTTHVDLPEYKVGVTGSGQGMTQYVDRAKFNYDAFAD